MRVEYSTPCSICVAEGKGGNIGFEDGKFCCQNGHEFEDAEGGVTSKSTDNLPQKEAENTPIQADSATVDCNQFEEQDDGVNSVAEIKDRARFESVKAQREEFNDLVSRSGTVPLGTALDPLQTTDNPQIKALSRDELKAQIESGQMIPMVALGSEMTIPGGDVLVVVRLPELYIGAIRELAVSSGKPLAQWLTEEFLLPRIEQEFSPQNQPI